MDSSAALAFVLPDEIDPEAHRFLRAVQRHGAAVTSLWPLEVLNVVLRARRRGRLSVSEKEQSIAVLRGLVVEVDASTPTAAWSATLVLAEEHGLTPYDASYLELALRRNLPLATRDEALRRAAQAAGAPLFA